MGFIESMDKRSRKLGIIDWKMAQGAAMCLAIIGVKLFPRVLELNELWLVCLAALLYIKPLYIFWLRH